MTQPLYVRELGAADRENLEAERDAIRQRVQRLTPREREVLGTMLMGLTSQETAITLGITKKTVEVHKQRIFNTLNARNGLYAVRMVSVAGY